ncbi:RICIN domain-containing protein [Micromonospora sp. NPDC002575]|uniref:RICIN domain-containing protein n=1 Tax=Micromonospora sp. NPDC002575 TaxID=3364222 RepID=UPI0036880CF5
MTRIGRFFGIVATVAAMTMAIGGMTVHPAQASDAGGSALAILPPGQYYQIRSQLIYDRCLDVANAGNGDGVAVVAANCWNAAHQKWRFAHISDGYYELHPLNSQRCLDVAGSGLDQGAPAMQWGCWGGAKQHWRLAEVGNGYYEIRNQLTQRCLDISGSGLDPGARAMIWDCWGGAKQRWFLAPVAA